MKNEGHNVEKKHILDECRNLKTYNKKSKWD
jgi:hypothetical protein